MLFPLRAQGFCPKATIVSNIIKPHPGGKLKAERDLAQFVSAANSVVLLVKVEQ
jgi:hypothetical protein